MRAKLKYLIFLLWTALFAVNGSAKIILQNESINPKLIKKIHLILRLILILALPTLAILLLKPI